MTNEHFAEARALLENEQLAGYPRVLAPLMYRVVDALLVKGIEAASLEPSLFERLMADPEFLEGLDHAVGLEHIVLRPGELVSSEMRELVGQQLKVFPGLGAHLTIVAPAEISRVPGLDYAVVRSPVLARAMSSDEAETLQSSWALLEEASGWPLGQGREWEARFVRIAQKMNLPAARSVEALSEMQPQRRRALWLSLIGHQRLQELPETHRPGAAALDRRLDALALEEHERSRVSDLLELVRAAYHACAESSFVAEGDYPLTSEDVDAYIDWVELSESAKAALVSKTAEQLQRRIRILTAVDQGLVQSSDAPDEARVLRLFRDQYLAAAYRRDVSPLFGVDPLLLAQAYVAEGRDSGDILSSLTALAQDANVQRELAMQAAREAVVEPEPAVEAVAAPEAPAESLPESPFASLVPRIPKRATTSPGINPFAESEFSSQPHRIPTSTPPMKLPPLPEVPPSRPRRRTASSGALPPLPERPSEPRTKRPRTRPRTQPFPDLESLPLPTPTQAKESAKAQTKEESKAAALPDSPAPQDDAKARSERARVETTELPSPESTEGVEALAASPPDLSSTEREGAKDAAAEAVMQAELNFEAAPGVQDLPADGADEVTEQPEEGSLVQDTSSSAPPAPRRSTSRLVTPGQAARFYSEAFRELQVLERDLLERGTWPLAQRRVQALGEEAAELALSLGPPARSGDADFRTALKKVQLVQSYLERIGPLMSGEVPLEREPEPQGVLDRLSGMFKRDDEV